MNIEEVNLVSKVLCIVQARCGSSRFPDKVLEPISGIPAIVFLLERLNKSLLIDHIVVATTTDAVDDKLVKILDQKNIAFFRGSTENVVARFTECSNNFPDYEIIVRITGDCPLIDPVLIDEMLLKFKSLNNLDYFSTDQTFPDGVDVEIFLAECLNQANLSFLTNFEQEHVTPWIKKNKQRIKYHSAEKNYGDFRITLDEKIDI